MSEHIDDLIEEESLSEKIKTGLKYFLITGIGGVVGGRIGFDILEYSLARGAEEPGVGVFNVLDGLCEAYNSYFLSVGGSLVGTVVGALAAAGIYGAIHNHNRNKHNNLPHLHA